MLCIWWDMEGVVYHELLKSKETVTGERYQHQLQRLNEELIKTIDQQPAMDAKSFFCMTMRDHTFLQSSSKHCQICNGKSFRTQRTLQIQLQQIFIYSGQWHILLKICNSIRTKMSKIGCPAGLILKKNNFITAEYPCCQIYGRKSLLTMENTLIDFIVSICHKINVKSC